MIDEYLLQLQRYRSCTTMANRTPENQPKWLTAVWWNFRILDPKWPTWRLLGRITIRWNWCIVEGYGRAPKYPCHSDGDGIKRHVMRSSLREYIFLWHFFIRLCSFLNKKLCSWDVTSDPLMPEVYFIMRNVLLIISMHLQPFTTLPHQKQTTALGT